MASSAGFGAMLSRLLAHRESDAGALAAGAGVPESELTAALAGAEPKAPLLRRLAPALELHTSDLFLIAGRRVPDDLAPVAGTNPGVSSLIWCMAYLPEVGRRVHDLVRTQPRSTHPTQAPTPEYDQWFLPGFGATLLRLFGNRNMSQTQAVKALYALAGFGPWSPATLRKVAVERKEMSADLVAACAVVLGIPPGDLAALADMDMPERLPDANPAAPEAAALIWETRRLSPEQMRYLTVQAHVIRHEYDDVVSADLLCHCRLFRAERPPPHHPEQA